MKVAFTRAYQKNPPMLPYTINSSSTTKKRSVHDDNLMEEEESEEEEDNIDNHKMVKVILKVNFRDYIKKYMDFTKRSDLRKIDFR